MYFFKVNFVVFCMIYIIIISISWLVINGLLPIFIIIISSNK
nr:MAG TPA: hypothetical protein [Caudoviricetes sp.]